jgi:hypothetical protein
LGPSANLTKLRDAKKHHLSKAVNAASAQGVKKSFLDHPTDLTAVPQDDGRPSLLVDSGHAVNTIPRTLLLDWVNSVESADVLPQPLEETGGEGLAGKARLFGDAVSPPDMEESFPDSIHEKKGEGDAEDDVFQSHTALPTIEENERSDVTADDTIGDEEPQILHHARSNTAVNLGAIGKHDFPLELSLTPFQTIPGAWPTEKRPSNPESIEFAPYEVGWFDMSRVWLERKLRTEIFWWPLSPPVTPKPGSTLVKISWTCVSYHLRSHWTF